MNEYISREDVIKKIIELQDKATPGIEDIAYYRVKRFIRDMPAADVQPVKRGRWIETHISLCKWIPEGEKEEGHSFYMAELKCSCCERYNAVTFALTLNKPDFCQLCGARMDGDTECQ